MGILTSEFLTNEADFSKRRPLLVGGLPVINCLKGGVVKSIKLKTKTYYFCLPVN